MLSNIFNIILRQYYKNGTIRLNYRLIAEVFDDRPMNRYYKKTFWTN